MIIYKATSQTSGKCYIGQTTKTLHERVKRHLKEVKKGTKTKLYNAIRKYGIDDFVWEVVVEVDSEDMLDTLETQIIISEDSFKNGYNMTLGGDGGDTISMKSKSQKKRQGAKKGNVPWNKGVDMKQLGYSFDNRKPRSRFTDEQKQRHSESIKASKIYREALKNRTPAKQIVIRDSVGNEWRTQKEWMTHFNLKYREAKRILSGQLLNGIKYEAVKIK